MNPIARPLEVSKLPDHDFLIPNFNFDFNLSCILSSCSLCMLAMMDVELRSNN